MNESQLNRYSRQLLLPNFDIEGQLNLSSKRALIVGVGGLGNIAATYLAGAGVGTLTLLDDDCIEESNLPRQVLFNESNVGESKAKAAKDLLNAKASDVTINAVESKLNEHNAEALVSEVDVVLDCTDNFKTRKLLHRACYKAKVSLVSGAAIRWEGQLITFRYDTDASPCYECLYPELSDQALSCNENGIMGPVVGAMGVMQSLDAVKLLSDKGEVAHGRLKIFDGFAGSWREMTLTQDPECALCALEKS
ncbi:HesA/MoeB/ThiF family protein [Marinomonas mediterranea]|jgi:Dinucleotide-utilizing enzymes involved in molybdopterin and thiamine biosynthesis family 2|uniref:UBA/THIF-type NAD/FAD binding protein n=1 Tax=Marinomonas mediterranea (strain ATCC 700492 / JCM 21426 / NBRC 103028 / MMB-1) TaxID=717774 RepID=F2JZ20_MARM1|nr:molybdopterin-synthase adenylyltransferase MoeB [Marinomonas mediterranea]ADZ91998.1 UBA/THIF-type NAD/FAD binding protein [Marinomonas mediterranea MMB-1]WCN18075.1 molybdopterin-synthase adenylyltransferase MoeB [Marinomonas mediterranea MMB-1]